MQTQKTRPVRRGDIYYAAFTSGEGSEQYGVRPVLVIQNDIGNRCSPTVIVAAITGHSKAKFQPTHVRLRDSACGLFRSSTVLLEQLRTLDKSRLGEYIGSIGADKLREVDTALGISVGLVNT